MKKILATLILTTALLSGCTGKKERSFWRLVEVAQARENGIKNYYTPAEKRQQELDLNRDMEYIHSLGQKYMKE